MLQPPFDKLWRKSIGPDVPALDWINVPERQRTKLLTTYSKIVVEDDRLRVVFNSRLAKLVNLGLTPIVSLAMTVLGFMTGSTFFGTFMLILGAATTLLLYVSIKYWQTLGDYLVIDRRAQMIVFPQQGVQLSFQVIDRFQCAWTIHHSRSVRPELYLLAKDDAGMLLRYPVMSAPLRTQMEQLVEFSGIVMEERHKRPLGFLGFLGALERCDTDMNNP